MREDLEQCGLHREDLGARYLPSQDQRQSQISRTYLCTPTSTPTHGVDQVDRALGTAALAGRFAGNDLIRILAHQRDDDAAPTRASETHSLQPGTSAWSTFGTTGEQ